MASIGHIAVGMAAARVDDRRARRPPIAALAIWSAVSLLADLDVIGFSFGVEYGDPWGHRGASHSFAMAVVAGLAATLAARALRRPALRTGVLTTALVASHALLDTMTDGGLGCALFWPFDLTRYFAPWRPIPVAPIGAAFFTPVGVSIAGIELVMFAPLFAVALWPRGRRVPRLVSGGLAALWAGSMWLIVSTDPVRQGVIGAILREDTVYTSGFSERAFAVIRPGASEADVMRRLGLPFRQSWFYRPAGQPHQRAMETAASAFPDECLTALFEGGVLTSANSREPCRARGIAPGMSTTDVAQRLGAPAESCWSYTWSPGNRPYRVRMVCFAGGTVETIFRHWQ